MSAYKATDKHRFPYIIDVNVANAALWCLILSSFKKIKDITLTVYMSTLISKCQFALLFFAGGHLFYMLQTESRNTW